ncbi:pilus assembly protein TadG-related protein [Streptomyces sp. P9(2023)]|uniref:Tad domain-containing protein n=1 Tax=Streptomyces sp. P9(2023) TaxID=3064394 RepID=UPI0028F4513B|nr:pilus assembly protein TadG-related protein [Streptomyces sp. P9(2023)]MDT9690584.1 pilus assembly protein TadG-related protein [Streptomyces sp. P9(2023)]
MRGPYRVRARLREGRDQLDDRGSGAGALILFALVFMTLAAFVIDGGLLISQRERAADIAEQAARYAAQDIDKESLYDGSGGGAPINFANCDARVREFVRETGMSIPDASASGCVSADAQRVEVEIQLTYEPVLAGVLYGGSMTVRGRSVAESVAG